MFQIRPILLQWHGIKVYSYPTMLYVGLVLGVIAENYVANLMEMNSARVFATTLVLLIPALAGARLLHIVSHWHVYRREPSRIWRRSEGGAALYGGLLLSVLASLPLLKVLQLSFGEFWDVATFTILVGMIFTRIGCLLNGCCAGRPTSGPLGLCLPNHHGIWQYRIPTQLFEAGLATLLLVGAMGTWNHLPFPGALFLGSVAGYSLGRLGLESTREQRDWLVGTWTIHHAISAILVILSFVIMLIKWLF
jgi:phosphatidylglycerol:prolipoprotein diacylglycerol transferase